MTKIPDEAFDNIERDFNEKISKLTLSDINNMCFDYFGWYQSIMQILPKYSINDTYTNNEDFKYNFEKIKYKLINVIGFQLWQIELRDAFNYNEPLTFTKQNFESIIINKHYILSIIIPTVNNNVRFITDYMEQNGYYDIKSMLNKTVISYDD